MPQKQFGDFHDHLHNRSQADPQEYRRGEVAIDESADPGADNGRRPTDESEPNESKQTGIVLGDGRGDAHAFGDVMQREANDQKRAQRCLAGGVRGADRKALSQVVQPNAERERWK